MAGPRRPGARPVGRAPRVDVSVKPTALSPLFAPLTGPEALDAAMARLRPVLDCARGGGATVHLDTEHDEAKDLGYELLRRMGGEYPDVQLGCVVQAYRKDSFADLRDLVAWSATALRVPLRVRLVKGAYWDHEEIVAAAAGWPSPVFARKAETDANFERCTRYLIDHAGEVRPAIASHNLRSLAHAIAYARRCELGHDALELQLLYGMAEPVHAALVREGHRVRVYAPVGELVPGIAYLVRRLLENTSNESFVRHRFAEGQELDELHPRAVHRRSIGSRRRAGAPGPASSPTRARDGALHQRARRASSGGPRRAPVSRAASVTPATVPRSSRPSSSTGRSSRPTARSSRSIRVRSIASCAAAVAPTARSPTPHSTSPAAGVAGVARGPVERASGDPVPSGRDPARATRRARRARGLRSRQAGRRGRRRRVRGDRLLRVLRTGGAPALGWSSSSARSRVRPTRTRTSRVGIGVVISPWNFPLAIPTGMVTAALVTGNAVLFKPAEQTPGIALRLVEVLHEAGVPPGVLAFLPGVGEEVGAAPGRAPGGRVRRVHRLEGGRPADHRTRRRRPARATARQAGPGRDGGQEPGRRRHRRRSRRRGAGDHAQRVRVRGPEVLGGVAGDRAGSRVRRARRAAGRRGARSFRSDRPRSCARCVDR